MALFQHNPTAAVGTVGTVATGFLRDVTVTATGEVGGHGHTGAFCGAGRFRSNRRFRGFRGFRGFCGDGVPS